MNFKKYQLISTTDLFTYEFFSKGPNGTIRKFIYFQKIDDNQYNLAFGDWNEVE